MRNCRVASSRARLRLGLGDGDGDDARVLGGAFDDERDALEAATATRCATTGGAVISLRRFRVADGVELEPARACETRGDDVACVGVACVRETDEIVAAFASGEFAATPRARDANDDGCDVVGEIPCGVRAFAWCPDGETCAVMSAEGRVVIMTRDFYPVSETRGDGGADDEDAANETTSGATISWRGDGRYFACSSTNAKTGETTMRVWEREGARVESVGETRTASSGTPATLAAGDGTPALAWQPRGALIAAAARSEGDVSDRVVFYERNGLRRGDFVLPGEGAEITSLAWSADSACLAAATRYRDGAHAVQIWTRSNMHWYLKHETRYPAREGVVRMEWDAERGDVLRAYTERGAIHRYDLFWETTVSDRGTCAVIDGDCLMLTPMFRTPVPPPMCAAKVVFSAPVIAAAFQPARASRNETVVALLSTGELAYATSDSGTDWALTADNFADSERAATWARWCDNEIPATPYSSVAVADAAVEHLAWVRDDHLIVAAAREHETELLLVPFDETKTPGEDAMSRRIVPVAVGALTSANGVAFAVARDSADLYQVDVTDTIAAGGNAFDDAWLVRSHGVPSADGETLKIISSRGLDVGDRYASALGTSADRPSGALVTLDDRGNLRIGNILVAPRVTSFATHVFGADGCAVTTPEESAEVAAAARDSSRWLPDAVPSARVCYITRDNQLFVAEVDDVIANGGGRARVVGEVAADDAHIGNWLAERSAADGARMGELAFSDLHMRMRRAMRPEAAKVAADATTRQVEDGARIVACAPGTTSVVLQMPRGNLETVAPKALVLPATACALRAGRYGDAYALAARQRVDLNLIVDYGWPNFLNAADAFVRDVDSADAVMELLEALDDGDVTAPGGIYEDLVRLYPPRSSDAGAGANERPNKESKVQAVCAAIRAAIETHVGTGGAASVGRWELAALTSYASGENPDLASALRRVAVLRERELEDAASNALVSSSSKNEGGRAVDAAAALKHLLFLVGGKTLYSAALGTCDLSLAYLVAQHAQMDPGEYMSELQEFQAMREHERRAEIAKRLGRHEDAITEYLLDDNVSAAGSVAAERKMFPWALAEAKRLNLADARRALLLRHAEHLSSSMRSEDAAIARLAAGDLTGALDEYRAGLSWRQALALANRLEMPTNAVRDIAEELCESLTLSDPLAAARVASGYLQDIDRAVELFANAGAWREACETAYAKNRADLMQTTIAPACAGAAKEHFDAFKENKLRSEKYVERLRDLRKHRERAELALDDGGWSELGGRPRAGVGADGLEDDDAMSEAPSLASDMSAYTDRTGLTSVVSGTSAASTIGGRKGKKRKDKKNKNNRSGLRAGSPTEERDLALHVIALAPVNKTLEEIGELLELLVSLGHEDDARALQRVVSEAVDAASRAKVDAETSLGELVERAKKAGESVEAFEKHASAFDATPEWKWSLLRAATGSSE